MMTSGPEKGKYRPFPQISLQDRQWPEQTIQQPPSWCSVDLRDGNQALINPMDVEAKLRLFQELVRIGFKEIEVGFPSAAEVEFAFVRRLIEEELIPDDVTIQVLVQARKELIDRTYESLVGAKRAIVHLYNSTSEVQRRIVFRKERAEILQLAVEGAKMVATGAERKGLGEVIFEYSPESFSMTELDFALEVCNAVTDVWQPTKEWKAILNLPATVEVATPNIYADQIEWMHRNLARRDAVVVSLHTHNDRGTGVAASELGLLAGGERVEGTLFGNGERTGNCDLMTMALNLFSQGIDPLLNFRQINEVAEVYQECTGMTIHPRHPYVGNLVYTAFSGSHQDAIAKGMRVHQENQGKVWEVPYLPIDPTDLGRTYESVIRINSQSGKGGASYILQSHYEIDLPRGMQAEFQRYVQQKSEEQGRELPPKEIWASFSHHYLEQTKPLHILDAQQVEERKRDDDIVTMEFTIIYDTEQHRVLKQGSGALHAAAEALSEVLEQPLTILEYHQHAVGSGTDVASAAYIRASLGNAPPLFGVAMHKDITLAALNALASVCNRSIANPSMQDVS